MTPIPADDPLTQEQRDINDAFQWQGMLAQGLEVSHCAEVAVRLANRVIVAEALQQPAHPYRQDYGLLERLADHLDGFHGECHCRRLIDETLGREGSGS